ncbi:MAG: BrnT family toxin [Treponema sp.]|jgi:uncharacterized DUF497 family protein|nr:BrnT family toxin [Treponema sp.]
MEFVWDEKKNRLNLEKHRIGFVQVVPAFFDPMRKEYYDDTHSSFDEDRYILAGFALDSVLIVSFTEPEPDTFCIISARRAKPHEVEVYYYGNGNLYS